MIGIKKNQDFARVYRRGRSKADRNIVVYRFENESETRRIGISVSKKVGNSVVRHRIKRRLKEIFRLHEEEFVSGTDYVVVARNHAAEADYAELEKSLLKVIKL